MISKSSHRRIKGLRVVCFCAIFVLVFLSAQQILKIKYRAHDCGALRYQAYSAEPADSVDIVVLSNSQLHTGINSMILYNETGITCWNMSIDYIQHTLVTEQLKTILTLNTPPKYVLFTPTSLMGIRWPSHEEAEALYTSFVKDQPSRERATEAYHSIRATFGEDAVDLSSFLLPFFHYHSRWNDLHESDFRPQSYYNERYQPFLKGQNPILYARDITQKAFSDPLPIGATDIDEESAEGWLAFFDLCEENGITPVALIQPRFDALYRGEVLETILEWLDENDILYLNYMEETALADLDMDYTSHFMDYLHLNFEGSMHFGQTLAYDLSSELDLEDHRGEEGYESWDADVTSFFDAYGEYIAEAMGDSYAPWWDMEDDLSF